LKTKGAFRLRKTSYDVARRRSGGVLRRRTTSCVVFYANNMLIVCKQARRKWADDEAVVVFAAVSYLLDILRMNKMEHDNAPVEFVALEDSGCMISYCKGKSVVYITMYSVIFSLK
jgi:hypothetical protein